MRVEQSRLFWQVQTTEDALQTIARYPKSKPKAAVRALVLFNPFQGGKVGRRKLEN